MNLEVSLRIYQISESLQVKWDFSIVGCVLSKLILYRGEGLTEYLTVLFINCRLLNTLQRGDKNVLFLNNSRSANVVNH